MRTCFLVVPMALVLIILVTASCGGPGTQTKSDTDLNQSPSIQPAETERSAHSKVQSSDQTAVRTTESELDSRVKSFLNEKKRSWHDWNIPPEDGQFMYDLIVEHGYKQALEIGTSTGHSGIWIAWALSKTGGKLTTIEIDEDRHREALENFEKAGLTPYIDARLADAHQLVKELKGPFDFVFSDADKDWYIQYFKDLAPKMAAGGCYVTHNVWMHHHHMEDYVEYLKSRTDFETTIERDKTSGVSVSYRKKTKTEER